MCYLVGIKWTRNSWKAFRTRLVCHFEAYVQLDEVEAPTPICFRNRSKNEVFLGNDQAVCTITVHSVWGTPLSDYRRQQVRRKNMHPSLDHDADEREILLFDQFPLNIICSEILSEEQYSLSLRPSSRARPSEGHALMHKCASYWMLAHPIIPYKPICKEAPSRLRCKTRSLLLTLSQGA